ncbi:hypothetical protein DFS33DRAFT_1403490 [Desarmillaria ectypa]|nr:hypothetical protein DFS33DRAFT_1403490 [Desarmillaria ectypa]
MYRGLSFEDKRCLVSIMINEIKSGNLLLCGVFSTVRVRFYANGGRSLCNMSGPLPRKQLIECGASGIGRIDQGPVAMLEFGSLKDKQGSFCATAAGELLRFIAMNLNSPLRRSIYLCDSYEFEVLKRKQETVKNSCILSGKIKISIHIASCAAYSSRPALSAWLSSPPQTHGKRPFSLPAFSHFGLAPASLSAFVRFFVEEAWVK